MAELWLGGRPELWVDTGDGFDPGAQQRMKARAQPEIISLRLTSGLQRTRRGTWETSRWSLAAFSSLLPAIV